ncbi:MAG: MBL fold metallo-hydrolase [Pseudomonadota bacterium]
MSTKMNRRTFSHLATGGLAAAVAGRPDVSFAAELATLNVGATRVSVLSDGHFDIPPAFFTGASDEALAAVGSPIEIGANVWLVQVGARRVLIDAGSGQALAAMFPTVGKLDMLLAAEGLNKGDIDDIVLTHMHADHIGGLMGPDANGFTSARIHVAAAEWAFWTNPDLASLVPDDQKPLVELVQAIAAPLADRVVTHDGEADLGDGLTLVPLPGHTAGHSGVRISSGDNELLIVADAIISQELQLADPSISYALDSDPDLARTTREALLAELSATSGLFASTHFAYPGIGRVARAGDGYGFQPME